MAPARVEDLLRTTGPQVLAALVRRHGRFDACEDAVQEALLAAATQWPVEGVPADPRAWLTTVARRRLTDAWRSERARRVREATVALDPAVRRTAPGADEEPPSHDDTLTLLLLCCHPALSPASQVALTLRAVGGLTTAEIAAAHLVPEATMAQRITRAKRTMRGEPFTLPSAAELPVRVAAVREVLYLVFTEGYTASGGADLVRVDLTTEAIRLARLLHALLPDDGESTGLLALMLLTDAHRAARLGADGTLVPLAEQDRTLWDPEQIAEGVGLVEAALAVHPAGPYLLQAAIAAVHAEAPTAAGTDWPQVAALYRLLDHVAPGPMVTLNRAVAVAMVSGPRAGLDLLRPLHDDPRTADHHRLWAVRAHLLERAGDEEAALDAYRRAARLTTSLPERRYLESAAGRLAPAPDARHAGT
ncbi:RNA polymerase sigma factor [Cellulomonas fimi]|uniref:Putative RNA polymerase, sigma-24 subunit, ECF subfamily n=1 Tax=Cellulomonas fimi (strain ATCC 484 / DSM 20113 / JCM 1341 / CCUG 24087 / LMG 16345 / NBRC 15513 / NCIMB 8980 / NCTC 7547 / NRS-133) TaxID=590998 RepID=F4H857_CELFA|nr:sigma-70 family RNA polymerase sigma factor [Cellulomonas fimi]AEE44614.1 putative RNA polymerase, sigma-24 subunit, ECF subfamily [Cellulomonas fimi ATCC 484]NNH08787.1 sigma-70 family RNA polymerase sigma factor [Cellulomonas fimi]VEH26786.1 RNA polymerase sigma factor [Cellulomonas fimi]